MLRVEVMKEIGAASQVEELGFKVWHVGANTRITGAGFMLVDVIEIGVDGR